MAIDSLASLGVDIVVNVRRASTNLSLIGANMTKTQSKAIALQNAALGVGIAFGALVVVNRIFSTITRTVKSLTTSFSDLEAQIINIEKIAKTGNINKLTEDFVKAAFSLRVGFKELSEISQSAARTGLRGDALDELVKTAVRFSKVAGDLTNREAAEGLGAIVSNFESLGQQDINRVASGIDILSDNFLATSGEILKTTARLSGFAESVGLTVQDTAAMTAALLSTKTSATVVRSSLVKLFTALRKEPLKLAEALKLTDDQFQHFFITLGSQPQEQFLKFVELLQAMDQFERTKVMQDLGISSSRLVAAFGNIKVDEVRRGMKSINDEMEKGTNLFEKFNLTSGTTAARIEEMKSRWDLLKASMGDTAPIRASLGALSGLVSLLTPQDVPDFSREIDFENLPAEIAKVSKELEIAENKLGRLSKTVPGITPFATIFPPAMIAGLAHLSFTLDDVQQKTRLLNLLTETYTEGALNRLRGGTDEVTQAFDAEVQILNELRRQFIALADEPVDSFDKFLEKVKGLENLLGKVGIPLGRFFAESKSGLSVLTADYTNLIEKFRDKEFLTSQEREIKRLQTEIRRLEAIPIRFKLDVSADVAKLKEKIGKIKDEIDRETLSGTRALFGKAGKGGDVLSTFDEFADLISEALIGGDIPLARLLRKLRDAEIEDISKPEIKKIAPPVFESFTDAWKKAQTTIEDTPESKKLEAVRKELAEHLAPKIAKSIDESSDKIVNAVKGITVGP